MIRCCIFDLDGTLLNTLDALTYTTNLTLKEFGYGPVDPEHIKQFVGDGYRMQVKRALMYSGDKELLHYEEALSAYTRLFAEHCLYHVRPYEGIPELLRKLQQKGIRLAIVSNKAQTTRNRIYGVVNREDTQYILLDTPGLHKPKSALGDYMVKVVTSSLSDVDCALLLVEPIPHVGGPEQALIDRIREEEIPCILCVNKIDTVEPAELLPVIAAYNQAWDGFDAIIPISAHTGSGLKDLMKELRKYAQEGPQLFPDGMTTDQPERQVMGEILREKLLLCLDKEIPHGTAVEITKFSERDSGVIDVDATIYCEKASHKGIIIGKQGAMLKKISSLARQDMEKFMGTKVYLETWVKVKENWRDNVNYVRSFGYRDE